jgi:uncharacterized protein YecE (DUF72 family)
MPESAPLTREERRARREERRAKQRAANTGRAEKMHAARLLWEKAPPGAPPSAGGIDQPHHIGCSGWFYWHWRGDFYPRDLPPSGWFARYAHDFDTVELNAPFYSWPTVAAVKTWLRQVEGRDFIYTVKVSELITHVKRFTGTKTLIRDFGHIADLLGPRMGCFLFQLPPSHHFTSARLRAILTQLDPTRRNVVEFRHATWWKEEVFAAFRSAGAIFCSCSGPRLPDALIQTADEIYLRFHGPKQWYQHDYTPAELAVWTQRIHEAAPSKTWAYFNNDRHCFALKNARELRRQLNQSSATPALGGTCAAENSSPRRGRRK